MEDVGHIPVIGIRHHTVYHVFQVGCQADRLADVALDEFEIRAGAYPFVDLPYPIDRKLNIVEIRQHGFYLFKETLEVRVSRDCNDDGFLPALDVADQFQHVVGRIEERFAQSRKSDGIEIWNHLVDNAQGLVQRHETAVHLFSVFILPGAGDAMEIAHTTEFEHEVDGIGNGGCGHAVGPQHFPAVADILEVQGGGIHPFQGFPEEFSTASVQETHMICFYKKGEDRDKRRRPCPSFSINI